MKKNLKIVSAAAAALLAVAPVVATAANVNADLVTNMGDIGQLSESGQIAVAAHNVVLNVANSQAATKNTLSGTLTSTVNGKEYLANFSGDSNNQVVIMNNSFTTSSGNTDNATNWKGKKLSELNPSTVANNTPILKAGNKYNISLGQTSFNVGAANAGKTVTFNFPSNVVAYKSGRASDAPADGVTATSAKVDQNGFATFSDIEIKNVPAVDLTNNAAIFFASTSDQSTKSPVSTGAITLNANSSSQLNTSAVIAAAKKQYGAFQQVGGSYETVDINDSASTKSLTDALKKLNVTPDSNGWFTAPKSFSFNLVTEAGPANGATGSLPITVTVPNGKETTPAKENGTQKTLMHVASTYDKNGKLIKKDAYHAYASIEVMPLAKGYYKVANKDEYIKAGNFDGTQRTVRHNSYEYRRTASGKFVALTHKVGKKHRKVVVKSGTQVTTFGSRLYNKAYYRIAKNRYIKAANF